MKSENVWKMMAISVVLLMVASVAGAVNMTGDLANTAESKALDSDGKSSVAPSCVPICKHLKMGIGIEENIPPPGIAPPAKPMIVNIYLTENKTEYIEELGNYTIEILYIEENRIVAEIYTSEILDILDLPFVSYMDTPIQAQLFREGVKCINADKVHNHSIKGKGVKVAIVDLGFANYKKSQEEGELPENLTVKCFRRDCDITGKGEIHGTACAEIVHDVAPDAELYLVAYEGFDYQLKEIIKYLISEEVDIVSHSAGWDFGLFDGTDYTSRIIDDVVKQGIIWVNAAGNYGQRHWEGIFTDSDSDNWHEYPCPGPEGDPELGQWINATRGEEVRIFLSWNDTWGYATQNYDLYIYNFENNWGIASKLPQNGLPEHIPLEGGSFIAPYTGTYYILIYNKSATKPVHFELYLGYHDLNCKEENSSLCVEATAFGVIAVGAVSSKDCSTLEPYSSRGPTNDGRIKPDYVGPTCVSTCAYNYLPIFCGTSGATPHIAGAIALELSSKGHPVCIEVCKGEMCVPVCTIKNLLSIEKIYPEQKDNLYGYGLPIFSNCSGVD